jgi:hypothetical protein
MSDRIRFRKEPAMADSATGATLEHEIDELDDDDWDEEDGELPGTDEEELDLDELEEEEDDEL